MTLHSIALGELMPARKSSVDPRKTPEQSFELYSIPAFDAGTPDLVSGSAIGSSKQLVRRGDVLLSKIVPHIRRAWIVNPKTDSIAIGSSEWIIFRDPRFVPEYLRQVLVSDRFHQAFMQTVAGVGGSLLRARPAQVAEIEIPLPPIEEQRRIAAVLDAAEALRAKCRQALAKLDTLTQAIFIEMFGDPVSNPFGFQSCRLEDVAEQITDGEHATPPRSAAGVKLLSARNVRNGHLDLADVDHVDVETYEKLRRRCDPSKDDLLISCSGTIGRLTRLDGAEPFALVRSVALVRPRATVVDSTFLEHQLRTPSLHRLMNHRANSSSQANLFQNQVRSLPVCLPPLTDQLEFAVRASAVGSRRRSLLDSLALHDELFFSLRQRALRGEL